MQGDNETVGMSGAINEFVQKHRKLIFISGALILVLLIGSIVTLSLLDTLNGKAIGVVEELSSRYETLQPTITEDFSELDVEELLADLEAFARKKTGYAAGRAWSIIAAIHGERGDWAAAENAWASAAHVAKKTYLVPIAFFNAGAAAEEQGNTLQAVEYYASSLEMAADFPLAPRARFAIGRLRESLGENAEALDAYRALIAEWPYDQVWTNLARSRIIALESSE